MILGEKKESEVLQKQGTLYLKTSFTFSLKLQIKMETLDKAQMHTYQDRKSIIW